MIKLDKINCDLLAEQSDLGMLIVRQNEIVYVNSACGRILGYPLQIIKKWNLFDFTRIVYPQDRKPLMEDLKIIPDMLNARNKFTYELRILTHKAKVKWIKTTLTIVKKDDVVRLLFSFLDISDRKEFNTLYQYFEQSKKEIMDRISHELRTPLITVKGYTSYLIELMEQHIDFTYLDLLFSLRLIGKGCDRLEDVIDSILLTKDIKTSESHTIRKLRVNSVITDLVKKYEQMGLNRDHKISVKVPEDLSIECDPFHFRLVFYHLVSNALKFTPPHGYIQIKGIEENDKIKISVKDNGIGLTKAEMNRIFTKFGKIERFGRGWDIEGSGIGNGLYLSKLIVELYGGTLWVESEGRNKGATFHFTLPQNHAP